MITKILSVATLLAATTAIANAATVLTLDSATLKSNAGTYTVSGQTIGSGYGEISVSVVFDIDALNTKMKATFTGYTMRSNVIYAEGQSSTIIGIKYDGSSASNSSGFYGEWTNDLSKTYALSDDLSDLRSFFTSNTVTAAALTFTIGGTQAGTTSNEGVNAYLTLKTSDGQTTTKTGVNTSLRAANFGALTKLVYDDSLVTYLTVDNTYLSEEVAKKQNEANIIASIPEPSAFGLLAGLGAIALAVSRRRRSR